MGISYSRKQKGRKTRRFNHTRRLKGGSHVYSTNHMTKLQDELTSNIETSFRMGYEKLDMLGCYGLKRADTYWKGLINSTYTLADVEKSLKDRSNPLVIKGLAELKSKQSASWSTPKSYRQLFLEKAGVSDCLFTIDF